MPRWKLFAYLVLLAGFYFFSAYFAAAALVPSLALEAGFAAWVVGMVGYWYLVRIGRDEPSAPLALLIFAPLICVAAGVIWWILHLLGWFGF